MWRYVCDQCQDAWTNVPKQYMFMFMDMAVCLTHTHTIQILFEYTHTSKCESILAIARCGQRCFNIKQYVEIWQNLYILSHVVLDAVQRSWTWQQLCGHTASCHVLGKLATSWFRSIGFPRQQRGKMKHIHLLNLTCSCLWKLNPGTPWSFLLDLPSSFQDKQWQLFPKNKASYDTIPSLHWRSWTVHHEVGNPIKCYLHLFPKLHK